MSETSLLIARNQKAISYLRIKSEYIIRAAEIIKKEFGLEWLESLSAKYRPRAIRALTSYHPIYHGLLAGVVNPMTLEVIELATYLEYVRKAVKNADGALPRLIQELKSEDKFYAYLFQLMVTARFRLVVPQLRMEPIIQSKQPDIAFDYLATGFIVETTRPGQPERTKRLHDFLERLFFWLDSAHGNDKLDLRLSVKVVDLIKVEKELKAALLQVSTTSSGKVSTQAFDIDKHEFAGTVQDFQAIHTPLALQGKELAFVTGRTTSLPFPPEMGLAQLPCRTTLVADLAMIENDLYQDVADKIDAATQQKVDQLKPLWNSNREIYVFVDVGEIATTRELDMDRVLPRLKVNIFNTYPGLLGGVVLVMRVWDNDLRRHRMIAKPIFAPGQRRIENFFVFRDVLRREDYNDFVGSVVGWGGTDGVLCSCESGRTYGECCKGIPPIMERLKAL